MNRRTLFRAVLAAPLAGLAAILGRRSETDKVKALVYITDELLKECERSAKQRLHIYFDAVEHGRAADAWFRVAGGKRDVTV